jgi:hypothetical protein
MPPKAIITRDYTDRAVLPASIILLSIYLQIIGSTYFLAGSFIKVKIRITLLANLILSPLI